MNQLTERIIAVVAIGLGLMFWLHEHDVRVRNEARLQDQLRGAKATTTQWQAKYATASARVDTVTVTVVRWASRTDTLRDSVLAHLTDTVVVKQYVQAVDSTVKACRDLVSDCARFRVTADSTIRAVSTERDVALKLASANRHSWFSRCGLLVGYGTPVTGAIRGSALVGAGCRVWP